MLVLSRNKNESIVIADTIIITVVEVRGDKVRLGIQAPREVPVHRSEVHDAIRGGFSSGDATAIRSPDRRCGRGATCATCGLAWEPVDVRGVQQCGHCGSTVFKQRATG